MEFLIRRADHGDWDDAALAPEVCHPVSLPSRLVSKPGAEPSIEIAGTVFQFIYEMPGIQVVVEGGTLDRSQATRVLTEIVDRMGAATGTPGYLLDIDSFGGAPIALAGPDERATHPTTTTPSGGPFCRGRELLGHGVMAAIVLGFALAHVWIGAVAVLLLWLSWGIAVARARRRSHRRES